MAALVEGEAKAGGWVALGNAWRAVERRLSGVLCVHDKVRLSDWYRTRPPHARLPTARTASIQGRPCVRMRAAALVSRTGPRVPSF